MGRSPFCPELAFFFCKSPATQGGETILVDGHVIASELPDEILEAYRAPLSFVSQYPEELWFKGASSRSIPEVLNFFSCSNHGSLDFRYTGAGSFYCKLETNAFKKSRISKVYSFANSILGPYKGNTAYIGGETISEENYETIRTLYAKYQVIVRLMPNDIVILDNYRIMHGRLKIENGLESRKMFARFVNASSSLLI
jgi:hypothetical protein